MAEIELICPGCAARYALPADAIPPAGREVECSDCGHVWQARPPGADRLDLAAFQRASGDDGDDRPAVTALPPASSRLAPDLLDILQDEVEHERRLRAAETPAADATADPASEEIDWPATTVILPAGSSRAMTPVAQTPVLTPPPPEPEREPAPEPEPQPAAPAARRPVLTRPAAGLTAVPRPRAASAPILLTEPRPAPRRGRAIGMALALVLAFAVVAVYLAAPRIAAQGGPLAEQAAALRSALDAARFWLAEWVGMAP
ncbi:zinc-ribbon domain-containing protein [Paracoccus aestuarii]|nr:zinc-ribbon domain-containing protein [Paracoccus aestuarii]WCQ98859.1 zinc-ribbon domain-containing protein [Paracoccus aestuarii]